MKPPKFGIDEAGRGPLAGPVSVGVFGVQKGFSLRNFPKGVDSKKMTKQEREKWFVYFTEEKRKGNIYFEVAFSSAAVIDKKGIVFGINVAMEKCLQKLQLQKVLDNDSHILLDGSLKAPEHFNYQKTIIKGDEKEKLIACASIIAKVTRDRFMIKMSKKFPDYHFEVHKGYGTMKHRHLIQSKGLCNIHRRTFIHLPI